MVQADGGPALGCFQDTVSYQAISVREAPAGAPAQQKWHYAVPSRQGAHLHEATAAEVVQAVAAEVQQCERAAAPDRLTEAEVQIFYFSLQCAAQE